MDDSDHSFQDMVFSKVCEGLDHLYQDQQLCDLTVTVGDKTFHCHRNVLAAVSQFFQSSLTSSWQESSSREVTIEHEDVTAGSFSLLLDIVYMGKDVVTMETVRDILKMAIFLQVKFLEDHCKQYLVKNMTPETCVEVWLFADKYQLPTLAKEASNMAVAESSDVSESEEVVQLSQSMLQVFLASQKQLTMDDVCRTVLRWVEADMERRKNLLGTLLPFVSFPHLTQKYLSSLMVYLMHPFRKIIFDDISDAMTYHLDSQNTAVRRQILARQDAIVTSPDMSRCGVLLGGHTEDKIMSGLECFPIDPPLRQYNMYTLKPLPEACGLRFATCKWKNELYVSGGSLQSKFFAKYKPGDDEWEVLPAMPHGREGHVMAAVSGKIYVMGGLEFEEAEESPRLATTSMVYGTKSREWSTHDGLPLPVEKATAAVMGHRMYVFGGQPGEGHATDVVQCVDTLTGTVYRAGRLPCPTSGARAVSDGGTIYLATDHGHVLRMKENYVLADSRERELAKKKAGAADVAAKHSSKTSDHDTSPSTVSFTKVGEFPGRREFGVFLDGDELVVCGGLDETGKLLDDMTAVHVEETDTTERERRLLRGTSSFDVYVLHIPDDFLEESTSVMQPFIIGERVTPNPDTCSQLPTVIRQRLVRRSNAHSRYENYTENAVSYSNVGIISAVHPDGTVTVDFPEYQGWTCPMNYLKRA